MNIEKVFDLPTAIQYEKITYHQAKRWYRENKKATKIIQSSFLIDRTLVGCRAGKVNMTRRYMKDDISYAIVILRRIMGLLEAGYLHI